MAIEWLQDDDNLFTLPILEPVSSYFSIPRLDEKPQDPIIQHIPLSLNSDSPAQPSTFAHSRARSARTPLDESDTQVSKPLLVPLWNGASLSQRQDNRSLSWGPNAPLKSQGCPFLTEQHPRLLGSLRHWAQQKYMSGCQLVESDLFSSLHLVVLGTSSPLYVWDTSSQSFVRASSSDAFDLNGISPSILQRLLDLGTRVRRLEQLIQELRKRRGRTNTTVHAFAHGLTSVLTFVRNHLSSGPLSRTKEYSEIHCLATLWAYYAGLEQVVIALASMCSRNIDTPPDKFSDLPTSPAELLSLVYAAFETHIERHSPRNVTAIVAYLLTVSSKPYIRAVCKLLAYGEPRLAHTIIPEKIELMDLTLEGDEPESSLPGEEDSIDAEGPFPTFIPANLASILPAAHKSLKLLEAAKPEHQISSAESPLKEISWIWNEDSIKNLWIETDVGEISMAEEPSSCLDGTQVEKTSEGDDLLAQFKIFDLDPTSPLSSTEQVGLDELILDFPALLPNITPNPSLLCELMFRSLHNHAASLSRALLAAFLDRSSFLCIDAHLELLRSHMLLTSHSFKSRLSAALFSDAEDRESHSVQLYNLLRYKSKSTATLNQPHGRWPVGLAPLLVTRDSWPPGGSELSFLLRTVIVDSQQNDPQGADSESDLDGSNRVMAEAESRLGFAIRELSGRVHDRWLDPLSIEYDQFALSLLSVLTCNRALDFLYLDYKVPAPLQQLIPTTVLSKYQRIFALLLRLMRVECAIRSVFRLTRPTAHPLFPTLSSARQRLLHFRFAAHSFLSIFSSYIYDTAIGGNFDAFLLRVTACRENPDAPGSFRDVFALAECHSSVLDDILSACLLRSTQRAGGDLLRGTLEVVLEFCVLVGDLKDGRMVEYQASQALDALYASFRRKVSALVRTLEIMVDRHGKSQGAEQLQVAHPEREVRVPPGGVDALRHLMTALNQNEWWTRL